MKIGDWVKRRRGKFHLVDSVIADRAVTRCGREMHRVTKGGELEVRHTMPLTRMIGQPQNCRYCDRVDAAPVMNSGLAMSAANEDDASTAPTEATDVP